jgi:hypothetical protein
MPLASLSEGAGPPLDRAKLRPDGAKAFARASIWRAWLDPQAIRRLFRRAPAPIRGAAGPRRPCAGMTPKETLRWL